MAEVVGLLRRQDGPQLLLHLGGVLGTVSQAQQAADADAVGVRHHHTGGVVDVPQDQIGRFPAYAGQLQQIFHGVRHLAAVVPQEHLRGQHDVPGLGPEKARGVDVLLHLRHVGPGQGLQCGEPGEEGGGHLIHPLVGALGGQTDGEQQLVVLAVVQRAHALRVQLFQRVYDGAHIGRGSHMIGSFLNGSFLISYHILPPVSTPNFRKLFSLFLKLFPASSVCPYKAAGAAGQTLNTS